MKNSVTGCRYCTAGRGFNPLIVSTTKDPFVLNPGPIEILGNQRRKYLHAWMKIVVEVHGERLQMLVDPTIAQFSLDITEDIAVWHNKIPGNEEAMEEYETHTIITRKDAATHTFCDMFSYE